MQGSIAFIRKIMMKKQAHSPKDDELKIVSRPSNEEIEEDLENKPNQKWKKIITAAESNDHDQSTIGEEVPD